MALTDIFTTSFLITLGATLLLVGFLFIYVNQKMVDQNHKISSMLGLISTMAEELNSCRSRVSMITNVINQGAVVNPNLSATLGTSGENLIDVSDGENYEEDEEDEDEEDEDEDEDDDDDDDDEDYDEDDEDNEEEDVVPDAELSGKDIVVLSDIKSIKFNNNLDGEDGEEDGNEEEDDNGEDLQEMTLEDLDNSDDDIDDSTNIEETNKSSLNLTELKTISINDLAEATDYKKLSLNKLRAIVVEKGLSTDASKLNKQKLLKMLEIE